MPYFRQITAAAAATAVAGTILLAATLSPGRGAAQASSGVEGTVWVRTSPAEPAGTFRIFLPNGTHVTGSCGETYRLDRWRPLTPTRLIVTEDGTRIPIDVWVSGSVLRLRLRLSGGVREERFRAARVPFSCAPGR